MGVHRYQRGHQHHCQYPLDGHRYGAAGGQVVVCMLGTTGIFPKPIYLESGPCRGQPQTSVGSVKEGTWGLSQGGLFLTRTDEMYPAAP